MEYAATDFSPAAVVWRKHVAEPGRGWDRALAILRNEPPPIAAPRNHLARPLPCLHLGPLVKRAGCCGSTDYHQCEAGRGEVRSGQECQGCDEYEADG